MLILCETVPLCVVTVIAVAVVVVVVVEFAPKVSSDASRQILETDLRTWTIWRRWISLVAKAACPFFATRRTR